MHIIITNKPARDKTGKLTRLKAEVRDNIKSRSQIYAKAVSLFRDRPNASKYSGRIVELALKNVIAADVIRERNFFEQPSDVTGILFPAREMSLVLQRLVDTPDRLIDGNIDGLDLESWFDIIYSKKKRQSKKLYDGYSSQDISVITDRLIIKIY